MAILAFIPIFLTSIGYSELNKADPDCGTTFTWGTRAFGPKTGWAGGWAIVAADVLVMASLAQIAGQYVFLLFGSTSIGDNATSPWVLLVGLIWLVLMTYICYRGIEVSAALQRVLLARRTGHTCCDRDNRAGQGRQRESPGDLDPRDRVLVQPVPYLRLHRLRQRHHPHALHLLGLGHRGLGQRGDQGPGEDARPGGHPVDDHPARHLRAGDRRRAGVRGRRHQGHRPRQHRQLRRALRPSAARYSARSGIGLVLSRLLILMVLSSAAASTQTTILPTARTTLSMATYRAIPKVFAKMHPRYLTPTVSTITMGVLSAALYLWFNYTSGGNVIPDAVTAIGLYIAFYYGLTGFACTWYYRKTLLSSGRNLWMQGILPTLGGLLMYGAGGWSLWADWDVVTGNSFTSWLMPFWPHWYIGGVFVIAFLAALAGLISGIVMRVTSPPFFKKETLTRATATLVPDEY